MELKQNRNEKLQLTAFRTNMDTSPNTNNNNNNDHRMIENARTMRGFMDDALTNMKQFMKREETKWTQKVMWSA